MKKHYSHITSRGFDSRPAHHQPTTLGKLFTPMCLCSPSSIIWYLARAFLLTCHMRLPFTGSINNGSIVVAVLKWSWSYRIRDINYLLFTFYMTLYNLRLLLSLLYRHLNSIDINNRTGSSLGYIHYSATVD